MCSRVSTWSREKMWAFSFGKGFKIWKRLCDAWRYVMSCIWFFGSKNITTKSGGKQDHARESQFLYDGIGSLSSSDVDNVSLRKALRFFSIKGSNHSNEATPLEDRKREKTLLNLCQGFIQLFLVTECSFITFDQAVQILITSRTETESGTRSMCCFQCWWLSYPVY